MNVYLNIIHVQYRVQHSRNAGYVAIGLKKVAKVYIKLGGPRRESCFVIEACKKLL